MAGRRISRDTVGEPAPAPVGGLYAIDFSADQWEALGFSRGTSRRSNLPGSRRWTERPIEYDQRALFDLAHRIETPAPPPRRQRKARKSSKWTESLNSIKLNQSWGQQGVAFRLPDNPAKLTSAACLEQLPQPSPRKSPRARAAQRVSMEGDTRSWHPQPTRWDAAAGMFVLAGTSSEDNDDNTARPPPAPVDEPDAAPSSSAIRPLCRPLARAPLPRLYVVEGAMVASSSPPRRAAAMVQRPPYEHCDYCCRRGAIRRHCCRLLRARLSAPQQGESNTRQRPPPPAVRIATAKSCAGLPLGVQ